MKKRKSNNRKISNRLSYTLIAIGIFIILGVGVYAVAGVSHSLDEIPSIPWSKLINVPSDLADGDNICPEGYTFALYNHKSECVKDFSAVSCSSPTLGSNTYVSARRVNGILQTRAVLNSGSNVCDSGWVSSFTASCSNQAHSYASATFEGDNIKGSFFVLMAANDACSSYAG